MAVIDASTLVKAFVAEEGSLKAKRLFETAAELCMPAHGPAEVAEVLVRKYNPRRMTELQLMRSIASLNAIVTIVPLRGLLVGAARIAAELKVSVYDALYVVAAATVDTMLITSDERLRGRLAGSEYQHRVVTLDAY